MNPENKAHPKEESSVESNLSNEYVPKQKLGNLPMESNLGVPEAIKKEIDKTRKEIEKFNEELKKKFKFIEAVGIVPAQVSQKIEEEYEVPLEDCKKKLIHILVVIPEDNFKELSKVKSEAVQIGKKINDRFWFHILTPVDLWNLGLDSKFDIIESFAMSFPVLDKGILGALRVAQIHKTLVLKKFEKYVTSYVIGGSLVTGTASKTSDVDVFVVIDDTDVKKMPRLELKEKLRGIIYQYIAEASAIAGVTNILNVQVYLMTDFWESVKDAHPVIFTFIRDGIPLYDRGTFLPWKLLLKMGKIKPSQEAIDLFMSSGDKLEETIKRRLLDIVIYDIFWGVSTPSQALLMLYGLPPGNVYETVKQIREIFVEKEKILEKKYADILEKISIKYYKGYEHGKIKEVSGTEIDGLLKDTMDYMKRLKELRAQIEKRVQEKTIEQVYTDVFGMLEAMLKKKNEKAVIQDFDEKLIKTGRFPQRFLEELKFIAKVHEELSKEKKKSEKDKTNQKETRDVDQARKFGAEIVNTIVEYNQRCDFLSMDRSKFLLKTKEKNIEIFFLEDTFAIDSSSISKIKDGKIKESNTEELRTQLIAHQHKESKITEKAIQDLKKIYGEFDLVY